MNNMRCPKCNGKMIYTNDKKYYCSNCKSYELGNYEEDDKTMIAESFMIDNGFQPGILYCFGKNLKGYLCNQCSTKNMCKSKDAQKPEEFTKSEIKHLKNMITSYYKIIDNLKFNSSDNTDINTVASLCKKLEKATDIPIKEWINDVSHENNKERKDE